MRWIGFVPLAEVALAADGFCVVSFRRLSSSGSADGFVVFLGAVFEAGILLAFFVERLLLVSIMSTFYE